MQQIKIAQGLREFPRELFDHADTLQALDLSDNQLCSLPADFSRFRQLQRLFLTNNRFDEVPAVLAQCPNLTMVSFKGNQLQRFGQGTLPDGLQWLILTDNQLTELPADMGRYQRLQKCALAGNQLHHLPDSMQLCRELGLLRLSLNQFTAFPQWLFTLPKLAWLALGANPATPVTLHSEIPSCPLQDFQLQETLGVGASGVIYRALAQGETAKRLGVTLCAVKQFKGWLTSDGCPKDEMANALNAGRHANLIPVLAQLTGGDLPGLAMALVPASFQSLGKPPSFASITRDTFDPSRQLSLAEIWRLAQQVTSVMAHLHSRRLVHGDLYAHNMLLDACGQLYLGDFGAATALDGLPPSQQQAMQQQEVAAFGYWLADMMTLLPHAAGELAIGLQTLRTDALHSGAPHADSFQQGVRSNNTAEQDTSQQGGHLQHMLSAALPLQQLVDRCLQPQVQLRPSFAQLEVEVAASASQQTV